MRRAGPAGAGGGARRAGAPAIGPRDRPGARPVGRDRLHLRIPTQRHRGCRRPLLEVGQRGAPARGPRAARAEHAAAPGVKSGNAVLLRGGSEALESNTRLAQILGKAVEKAGLPGEVVQAVEIADRAAVLAMLTLDRYLDLIIPRGGEEFVRLVAERSTVPVLKHDKGLCHVYLDEGADPDMAIAVTVNAQAPRVSVCKALETLLVHAAIAPTVLPGLAARLADAGVEVRAD